MAGRHPGYTEVLSFLETVHGERPDICTLKHLGESVEGRDIPCLLFTDPSAPADDKQHVLVVAGHHGSEESGRAIALELVSFLAGDTEEAREVRRRQCVAVIPCANPDGAEHDTYRNADDADIAHTYRVDAPAGTPEGRAVEKFALEFAPEVNVDIHGLAGGSMKDRTWFRGPLDFTPDRHFLFLMGHAMSEAAEKAGYPQCEVQPPGPFPPLREADSLGHKLAAEVKSLSFGLETIEFFYGEREWREDGIVRLRRLLGFGNTDAFGLGEAGYPASLVSGSRICGLKSHGVTAADRRRSRIALTRFLRHNFALVEREADGPARCARVKVVSETVRGENPRGFTILLRIKKPCTVRRVSWEDEPLGDDREHGYVQIDEPRSLLLLVSLAVPFGGPERRLTVEYDSPLFG